MTLTPEQLDEARRERVVRLPTAALRALVDSTNSHPVDKAIAILADDELARRARLRQWVLDRIREEQAA